MFTGKCFQESTTVSLTFGDWAVPTKAGYISHADVIDLSFKAVATCTSRFSSSAAKNNKTAGRDGSVNASSLVLLGKISSSKS